MHYLGVWRWRWRWRIAGISISVVWAIIGAVGVILGRWWRGYPFLEIYL
jgi:hypothetical protein